MKGRKKWWNLCLDILREERGDTGGDDFTKEELETLGEETEEKGQETQDEKKTGEEQESETEQSTETAEAEKEQAEEEQNMVPQSRVDQIVREREDLKRKNDLLKRDPDAYQKLYPDEFEEEAEQKVTPIKDFVIQDGPYKDKSLSELYQIDPIAANTIHFNLLEEQKAEKEQRSNLEKQSQQELNEFSDTMAKEMFGKEKVGDLPEKEGKQVDDAINKILDWMAETGRGGGNITDAYFLMNKEKILANAAEKGVKTLIDTSSKGVQTVGSKKDIEGKSGYDKFTDYTVDQLATYIDNLSEKEADDFGKNAPQELKDKFPKAFAAWE